MKKGISLITLIITIIVIIILAAIVIFTGLRTPDSAQFSSFAQQVDNVQMAVNNKYADLKTKHAIAKEYRTDEQIYIEIATAVDPEQYASMGTTTVKTGESSISETTTGIQNIIAENSNVSSGTNVSVSYNGANAVSKPATGSLGMELPKVRENNTAWYVTKEGRVFNANGFAYSGKTYFDAKMYQDGELGSNDKANAGRALAVYDAMNKNTVVVTRAPEDGSAATALASNPDPEQSQQTKGIAVTFSDGTTETLKPENFAQYLGREVTNYTPGTGTINEAAVSSTYRLYWIDFDGKYGDGANTIYLKADKGTGSAKIPQVTAPTGDTEISEYAALIHKFNPSIPVSAITDSTDKLYQNDNMRAVAWLLTASNFTDLKPSAESTGIKGDNAVNYVIGGAPLEMMMDSYNAHYGLAGSTPDYSDIANPPTDAQRKKLFYRYYPTESKYGYQVGPNADSDKEYANYTSARSVYSDSAIGSMYNPGSGYYWLASPSTTNTTYVMRVNSNAGGSVGTGSYSGNGAFCPLVSLKSNVQLTLSGKKL